MEMSLIGSVMTIDVCKIGILAFLSKSTAVEVCFYEWIIIIFLFLAHKALTATCCFGSMMAFCVSVQFSVLAS